MPDLYGTVPIQQDERWFETVLSGTAASVTLTLPTYGNDLEIVISVRTDEAVTSANCNVQFGVGAGLDTTTTDYHWQRAGTNNAGAVSGEGNTFAPFVVAGASAVSGHFSWTRMVVDNFLRTDRQKTMWFETINEQAAQSVNVTFGSYKRITAGVGALTDALTSILFDANGASNFIAGSVFRYRVIG